MAADGYLYNGKPIDRMPIIRDLLADLPSVEAVLICPFLEQAPALDGLEHAVLFDTALAAEPIADYSPMPFNHPLYHVFIGDHRRAEMHHSWCWRHFDAAYQGTPSAM